MSFFIELDLIGLILFFFINKKWEIGLWRVPMLRRKMELVVFLILLKFGKLTVIQCE